MALALTIYGTYICIYIQLYPYKWNCEWLEVFIAHFYGAHMDTNEYTHGKPSEVRLSIQSVTNWSYQEVEGGEIN